MTLEEDVTFDPDCVNYTGDINEVTAEVCTVIPTFYHDSATWLRLMDPVEAECIFPFTVDDKELDGCTISGIEDFTHSVFTCPIRSIKNRNSSTYFTNFTTPNGQQVNELLNGVHGIYCPTNSIRADTNYNFISAGFGYGWIATYIFNSDGPVYGPNGELELDPENYQCRDQYGELARMPVFGTCKNNCRGGKFLSI